MISYYDAVTEKWSTAKITGIDDQDKIIIKGLTGSLTGWEWKESLESLSDPELYQKENDTKTQIHTADR